MALPSFNFCQYPLSILEHATLGRLSSELLSTILERNPLVDKGDASWPPLVSVSKQRDLYLPQIPRDDCFVAGRTGGVGLPVHVFWRLATH